MSRTFTNALVLVGIIAGWHLVPWPSQWIEAVYARGLFVHLNRLLVPIADSTSASLTTWLAAAGALLVLIWLAAGWQRSAFGRLFARKLLQGVTTLLAAYALFLATWGANYERLTIEELLDLEGAPVRPAELEDLAHTLVNIMTRDVPPANERDAATALASLRDSLILLVNETTGVSPALNHRIKELPQGSLLRLGSSGFINPIFLEPHVERALPEPFWLATAAHELAHVAGFAGEADADVIAALAGLRSDNPYARYATALKLFVQVGGNVPAATYRELERSLPADARSALGDLSHTIDHYRAPGVTALVQGVFDRFLRAQGVDAGIADYGRTVRLLAQAERAQLISGARTGKQ